METKNESGWRFLRNFNIVSWCLWRCLMLDMLKVVDETRLLFIYADYINLTIG